MSNTRALGTGLLIGAVFAKLGYPNAAAFVGLGLMFLAMAFE